MFFKGSDFHMSLHQLEASLALFNLKPGASYQEVRKVYLELLQRWHPDRFEQQPSMQDDAVRITQQLNLAFETLTRHLQNTPDGHRSVHPRSDSDFHSDWTDYFYSHEDQETDEYDLQAEDTPPTSQFESCSLDTAARPGFSLFAFLRCSFAVLFAPLFWLVDIIIYCCFEKHSVLILAAVIALSSLY